MRLTFNPHEFDMFIGLDVDSKSYAITFLDQESQGRSLKMSAQPQGLYGYFQKRFPQKRLLFAYEAGPTGYQLYDYLVSQNQKCMMLHPAGIPKSARDRVKTNRLDSQKIAEQLKTGQLEGIRVPSSAYRQLRHLTDLRAQYARRQSRIKQKIKSLLLFENIILLSLQGTAWNLQFRQALAKVSVNETVRFKLDLLLKDLEDARVRILTVLHQMRQFVRQETGIQKSMDYLQSIPGFGFIVSAHLLARIGNPGHLRNVRELAAFCGLVPCENSTGETVLRGPITRTGDSLSRALLVQAAWSAIRKDSELYQFYCRIRSKRGRQQGAQIAIVAVARKLTQRAYRVLKDQRPYIIRNPLVKEQKLRCS